MNLRLNRLFNSYLILNTLFTVIGCELNLKTSYGTWRLDSSDNFPLDISPTVKGMEKGIKIHFGQNCIVSVIYENKP